MTWFEVILGVTIFIHTCFMIAYVKKDNSVMTFFWPLGILLIAIISYFQADQWQWGLDLLFILSIVWALRLFIHTFERNIRRGYEDFRYRELRENTESGFLIKSYLQFFFGQGVFMLLVGSMFVYAYQPEYNTNLLLIILGSFLFGLGFIIETVADLQLRQFKQKNNKEEVLTSGLWSISRHPNYFGEILVWWGLGLVAFHPANWWLLFSPLLVTLLLRYLSGVPLLEERYTENTEYQQYKATTNALFPFI